MGGITMRWKQIALSLAASLMCPLTASAATDDEPRRLNVIIILCDNLGYGDIEPFGGEHQRTPHLNRMAREGRKFTHFCVTSGVCTPSRASLLTGCYAQRLQMDYNPRDGHVLRPVSPFGLHPQEHTIAELLRRQGYATAMLGKWHLGDQPAFLPTQQGFDHYLGIPYSDDMTARRWTDGSQWPPLPLLEGERVVEAPVEVNTLTARLTEHACAWIADHRHEPFFLYFSQITPGSTRRPPASPAFSGRSRNGPWGDAVEELDASTGQILVKLRELQLAERTLVIWTSDNGAPLTGRPDDPSRGSNQPLHGRGYTTAEGAFRVPTLMWLPGTIPPDSVCAELCTTLDLLPTLVAWAGGAPPRDRQLDGYDIRPLIVGEPHAASPYEAFLYFYQDQLQAIRSGPWKLFLPLDDFVRHPHFQPGQANGPLLFHVVDDIGCRHNVAAEHHDIVDHLTAQAELARAEFGDRRRRGPGVRERGMVATPQPFKKE